MQNRIVIAGAGSIGCFIGGLLAQAGHPVTLLARPRVVAEIRSHGLHLTDFAGLSCQISADQLALETDPACLDRADLVLVTVKTGACAEMAALIARHAAADCPVISLQNGLDASKALAGALSGRDLRAGMVAFNVVPMGAGRYHRAISGEIVIASGLGALDHRLDLPEMPVTSSDRIVDIQWGKLLLNLNNAPNALSGLPIQTMLMQPGWRRLLAEQLAEALDVLRAAAIPVQSTTPVRMQWVPHILRLPTPLFRRVAARMLTIDPQARSSMSYDLELGRPTEIAALQGAVIAQGVQTGTPTPICSHIQSLIRQAEAAGRGLPGLTPEALRPV